MIDKIKELITEAEEFTTQSLEEVEAYRIKYLGKKGLLNTYFAEIKNIICIVPVTYQFTTV